MLLLLESKATSSVPTVSNTFITSHHWLRAHRQMVWLLVVLWRLSGR